TPPVSQTGAVSVARTRLWRAKVPNHLNSGTKSATIVLKPLSQGAVGCRDDLPCQNLTFGELRASGVRDVLLPRSPLQPLYHGQFQPLAARHVASLRWCDVASACWRALYDAPIRWNLAFWKATYGPLVVCCCWR